MIVIGSRAAKFWSHSLREPNKDWDVIGSEKEIFDFLLRHKDKVKYSYPSSPTKLQVLFNDGTKVEFESDVVPSNQIISQEIDKKRRIYGFMLLYDENLKICPPVFLMLMKRALLYWPVHWNKTINDYHEIRKAINNLDYGHEYDSRGRVERGFPSFLSETELKFFNARLEENTKKFGKKNIKLNMPERKFFDRSKKIRVIEHDILHKKVMFHDAPLYSQIKVEEDMPLLSKDKFFNKFNFDYRIKLAQEECMAIGFERFYISSYLKGEKIDVTEAYRRGIELVASRLTKGWFCDFVIDHYDHVLNISEEHLKSAEMKVLELLAEKGDK